jgi:hypothetical protein
VSCRVLGLGLELADAVQPEALLASVSDAVLLLLLLLPLWLLEVLPLQLLLLELLGLPIPPLAGAPPLLLAALAWAACPPRLPLPRPAAFAFVRAPAPLPSWPLPEPRPGLTGCAGSGLSLCMSK